MPLIKGVQNPNLNTALVLVNRPPSELLLNTQPPSPPSTEVAMNVYELKKQPKLIK